MANASNIFDLVAQDYATFLATAVSDGTYSDVLSTLKVDAGGQAAAATKIATAAGQLWSNACDDYIGATYATVRNLARGEDASVGELTLRGVTYTFPAADGTVGQVLSTDGSRGLSWATAASAPDLNAVLAVGDTTGGEDIVVEQPDRIVWATSANGIVFDTGRYASITSAGGETAEEIGAALHAADSTTSNGDTVSVSARGSIRLDNAGTIGTYEFALSEVWTVDGGASARVRVDESTGAAAYVAGTDYRIAFTATNSGTVDSLFLTIDEGTTASVGIEVFAKITVSIAEGEAP